MSRFKRTVSTVVALSILSTSMWTGAHAGTISTQSAAEEQSASQHLEADRARVAISSTLQREDLRQALKDKGVSPDEVQARVNSLSDAEVIAFSEQLEHAPAGASDVIGALVFIFVLLLVTDILGLTKVFPFTRSIRR